MNMTMRNILTSVLAILSLITLFAFMLMTHPLVIHVLADEIVPVR